MGREGELVFEEVGLVCLERCLMTLETGLLSSDVRFGSLEGRLMTPETGLMSSETKSPCFLTICGWFERGEGAVARCFGRGKIFGFC
jgi:hypothetical protein